MIIPIISSIIPVYRALDQQLNESLDTNRAKASGIQITVTDGAKQKIGSYLIVGTICVVYGLSLIHI